GSERSGQSFAVLVQNGASRDPLRPLSGTGRAGRPAGRRPPSGPGGVGASRRRGGALVRPPAAVGRRAGGASRLFRAGRSGGAVIESLHSPALHGGAENALDGAHHDRILAADQSKGIAAAGGAAGAADAVDVSFGRI